MRILVVCSDQEAVEPLCDYWAELVNYEITLIEWEQLTTIDTSCFDCVLIDLPMRRLEDGRVKQCLEMSCRVVILGILTHEEIQELPARVERAEHLVRVLADNSKAA